MADNNQKPLNPPVQTAGGSYDAEEADLRKQLLRRQLENAELESFDRQETNAKRLESKRRLENLKTTTLKTEKKRKAIINAEQASCPHMKPMGHGSAVAATRDHSGHVHFLCQYCQKTWDDSQLPPSLRIPSEFIGGPHNTGVIF